MLKVVITGPESCGKTTLASGLSDIYGVPFVAEYAREYLEKAKGRYRQKDLLHIAEGQMRKEAEIIKQNFPIIICDTALHVIRIWSIYKFGHCDEEIEKMLQEYEADVFLLTDYSIPYEVDPLRETPLERSDLYDLYYQDLTAYHRAFHVISGGKDERLSQAKEIIDTCFDLIV